MFTVREDQGCFYVRDDGIYIGYAAPCGSVFRAYRAINPVPCKNIADLPTAQDAIDWLVHEHRDTPWSGRPDACRVAGS